MGYLLHPQITTPPDSTIIWRYMDLPKFLLMLDQRGLYYALLTEFEDSWEGVIGRDITASLASQFSAVSGQVIDLYAEYMKHSAVNCWYKGEEESIAMWGLYTSTDYGVAIKSNIGALKVALDACPNDVFLGAVTYQDHTAPPSRTIAATEMTPYAAVLQKRKCYKHECELRAITDILPDFPDNPPLGTTITAPYPTHGKVFPIDLGSLIQSVTTGPRFPGWAHGLLSSALSRAGIAPPVVSSSAFEPPITFYIE